MPTGWAQIRTEAFDIVDEARDIGVTMRLVGSTGIRLHCAAAEQAMDQVDRPAKDIDFVVPKGDRKGMRGCLERRGYVVDRDLLVAMEGARYSFAHPLSGVEIDVFVERLEFNHTIEVRDRMQRHPATLPPEDLLLAKLQIVKATATDLLDTAVLLATHEVVAGDDTPESLDAGYIAGLLSVDWGFHHTAVANLSRLVDAMGAGVDVGTKGNVAVVDRVERLSEAIATRRKSRTWRLRDRLGERVQWWQDVDEREATY